MTRYLDLWEFGEEEEEEEEEGEGEGENAFPASANICLCDLPEHARSSCVLLPLWS